MDEQTEDLTQYRGSFEMMRAMGMGGLELVDFIRTYGIEVAAVQLRVKAVALRKFLHAAAELSHVGAALREVQLRRAGKRVPLDQIQRTNFNTLVDNIRALVGTQPLARRLGITRQAIYSIVAEGGPRSMNSFVAGVGQLLGYNTMTGFLAALQEGVPNIATVARRDFTPKKPKGKVKVKRTPKPKAAPPAEVA